MSGNLIHHWLLKRTEPTQMEEDEDQDATRLTNLWTMDPYLKQSKSHLLSMSPNF